MKWEFKYFIPFGEVTLRYISQFHFRVFFIIDYSNFNSRLDSVSSIETLELIVAKLANVSNLSMILTRIVALVYIYSHCTVFIHAWLDERLIEISTSHE
jgi:hypothetical protein